MTKQILVLCCIFYSLTSFAQTIVSTQGDSYENASGSVSFTIGEVLINTETDGTTQLTQGFHQTLWEMVSIKDFDANFYAEVYPNPSSDLLHIKVKEYENVSYQLFDAVGKAVAEGKLSNETTQVQVAHLTSGNYHLQLTNEKNTPLKNFKLIKTH